MASAEEFYPQSECCEICGAVLGDEVVLQEFADGSLVRLCAECAAGANVGYDYPADSEPAPVWPESPAEDRPGATAEIDPLERTRELLMPVSDLLALQTEMQAALERLAASLQRFALEMITESQGRSVVESRVQQLEHELDLSRSQLSRAQSALDTVNPLSAGPAEAAHEPTGLAANLFPEITEENLTPAVYEVPPAPAVAPISATSWQPEAKPNGHEPADKPAAPAGGNGAPSSENPAESPAGSTPAQPSAPLGSPPPVVPAQAVAAAIAPIDPDHVPTFRIEEVQAAQRYFNESPFINRVRDVRQSLGRPKANLTRLPGSDPLGVVTVAWEIVWYQYLVDMRRDVPPSADRVTLYREGMDLDELAYHFREKNAVINDDGRLDASELEVRLLSDPSALITEMTDEQRRQLEDATEEVWDARVAPEFKWDD
jgi:hypothetical protein